MGEGSDEMPVLPAHAKPREPANLQTKKKNKTAQNKTLRRRSEEPAPRSDDSCHGSAVKSKRGKEGARERGREEETKKGEAATLTLLC